MSEHFEVWNITDQETVEGASDIKALDAEEAAENFVEQCDWDGADYRCAGGQDFTIGVRENDGTVHRFIVSGEMLPYYTARQTILNDSGSVNENPGGE